MVHRLINVAFDDVFLADGRRADKLRLGDLRRQAEAHGIPGMAAVDGKSAILQRWREHVHALARARYPDRKFGATLPEATAREIGRTLADKAARAGRTHGREPVPLEHTVAKQVAAMAERGFPERESAPSTAPMAPIASTRV